LIGLGFWSLRGLELGRFMTGPVLLAACAATVAIAGLVSQQAPVFLVALALVALGFGSLRGWVHSRVTKGPVLLAASAVALGAAGLMSRQVLLFLMAGVAAGLAWYAWQRELG
jgi:hypothetical protein